MASDTTIRLEVEGQKFWEITQTGNSHTVRFGKLGTAGQTRTKEFDSEEATTKDVQKLVKAKKKKGYAEANGSDGVAAPAAPKKSAPSKVVLAIEDCLKRFRQTSREADWQMEIRPPASDEQIASLETRWGRPLPPSYRAFLKLANGIDGFASMRLLGTEDQEWGAKAVAGHTEFWEEDEDDDEADYDRDSFTTKYLALCVGEDAHNFYTFENVSGEEMQVVGWEYGGKEEAQSFLLFLDEECEVPNFDDDYDDDVRDAPKPREVSRREALDAMAAGPLSGSDEALRIKALDVLHEPPYFVDEPKGALEQAVKNVVASQLTEAERAHFTRQNPIAPRNIEYADFYLLPPAGDYGLGALNNFIHANASDKRAEEMADHARAYANDNPYLGHNLACIFAKAGRYDDAFEMCKAAVQSGYREVGELRYDAELGPLLEEERFKELFRQPLDGIPVPSHFGPYEVEVDDSCTLPPLLETFIGWIRLQPRFCLGWFAGFEVAPFPERKKNTKDIEALTQLIVFHSETEVALEHRSILALHDDGHVVLVHEKDCFLIASSVAEFLSLWSRAQTGVSALDQDKRRTIQSKKAVSTPRTVSRRPLLRAWLEDQNAYVVAASPCSIPTNPTSMNSNVGSADLPKGTRLRHREVTALPDNPELFAEAAKDGMEWNETLRRYVNVGIGTKRLAEWLLSEKHALGDLILADLEAEIEARKSRKAKNLAKKLFAKHVEQTFLGPLSAIAHEFTHFLKDESYFSFRYGFVEKLRAWDCGPSMHRDARRLVMGPYGRLIRSLSLANLASGDMEAIGRLTALDSLSISMESGAINSLAPMANLGRLQSLNVGSSAITDLSPLRGLPLRSLSLGTSSKPFDLSPLAGHQTLGEIDLANVAIESVRPLLEIPHLHRVTLWGVRAPLEDLLTLQKHLKSNTTDVDGNSTKPYLSHHHEEV